MKHKTAHRVLVLHFKICQLLSTYQAVIQGTREDLGIFFPCADDKSILMMQLLYSLQYLQYYLGTKFVICKKN